MTTNDWNCSNYQTKYFNLGKLHYGFSFHSDSSKDWKGRETGIKHPFFFYPRIIINPLDYELSIHPTRTVGLKWGKWSICLNYCLEQ